MVRKATTLAGIAALAVSLTAGGAMAGPGGQGKSKGNQFGKLAAKACAAEKKAIGKEAFDELYGKPSTPNCIGVKRKAVNPEFKNAAKKCKAEGLKGKAFGKCVSGKVAPELKQETKTVVNAAKACKAEREDPNFAASHDGKTFDEFYGTNKNLKNAFGKCVSTKAKAKEPAPAPTA